MPSSSITYSNATTRGRDSSRREVRGEREARGLGRVQPGADQQERERGCDVADPERAVRIAGEQDQRERHDREAAELQQRAEPDVRHAPPAEDRAVRIGAEPDQRAERREHQRQRHHQRDQPGGDAELDDHHAVQRAGEQHHRHADRDLEQREPQQPGQWQFRGGRVGERQEARADPRPRLRDAGAPGFHPRAISRACEV